jgi:hypothetical protein
LKFSGTNNLLTPSGCDSFQKLGLQTVLQELARILTTQNLSVLVVDEPETSCIVWKTTKAPL